MSTRSVVIAGIAFGTALALVRPTASDAQAWRTMESSRQVRDSQPVSVHVTYGAGEFSIAPSGDRSLYNMTLRYDADRSTPKSEYDASSRALRIGLGKSSSGIGIRSGQNGSMNLALARGVPMSLELDLGAVEGKLDLGGLALQRLELRSGASDVSARFGSVNTETLAQLNVESGAASVSIEQLGNANVRNMEVNVGVGSVALDFGGALPAGTVDMNVSVAVGGLTIRVPKDVAIEVEVSRTLASFKLSGLEKRGKSYVTTDTENATRHIRVHGAAALGSVEIIRY